MCVCIAYSVYAAYRAYLFLPMVWVMERSCFHVGYSDYLAYPAYLVYSGAVERSLLCLLVCIAYYAHAAYQFNPTCLAFV